MGGYLMSGHWYNKEGQPEYTQTARAGHERPTTLSDAKKKGLFKSVTTILKLLDKPGLTRWTQDQILDAALSNPISKFSDYSDESIIQWKAIVLDKANKIGRDTAELGSRIHDSLEGHFNPQKTQDESLKDFTRPAIESMYKNIDKSFLELCHVEQSFSNTTHRFGGKVDFFSRQDKGLILDFKTKNKDEVNPKTPYFEHCMQLAAYRIGLDLPEATCYNLYISSTKKGQVYLHRWAEEEVSRAERMFLLLNEYFDLSNGLI